MEAIHESLHDEHALALGVMDGLLRLARIEGERLLAEHVLARVGGLADPLGVQVIGKRDIDGLDLTVGQQLLVGTVGFRDTERLRLLRGPLARA